MRPLYSLLAWAAQPLLRRKLHRRARTEPLYAQHLPERFGQYHTPAWPTSALHPSPSPERAPVVWLHAVSLGETRAAAVLIAHLRTSLPGMRLLLTHGTATGREAGTGLLRPGDAQVWQPWDTPAAVRRFLAHFQPDLGVLMETEVWPNLVAGCARAGVPLCLVNARMSAKTLRQSLRLRLLAGPAYRGLHAVWAQSEADAQRLRQLGAPVRGVLGNFKFDATPDPAQLQQGRDWNASAQRHSRRPVLLLASSREGEEQMLLDFLVRHQPPAHASTVDAAGQPVQWLVVPRHPQRFAQVAQLFADAGYRVGLRSQWAAAPTPADVWVGDSLGEMALYYGLADAALLGGSFAPLGGQNLIEAAACGTPVFMGPHVFNFADPARLALAAGAARSCADMGDALVQARALVYSPAEHATMQHAAQHLGTTHQGAARSTAQALAAVWVAHHIQQAS